MTEAPILLRRVTLRHRRSLGPVFERIDLELGPVFTTILGDDGSGKSTLLRAIAGLLRPRRGQIDVLGARPTGPRRRELMKRIGYLPQGAGFLPRHTVTEHLAYAAWLKGVPREFTRTAVERALVRTGLESWQGVVLGHAAPWVQRRAGIAAQLVHDPAVLLLDEPNAGLTLAQREAFHQALPAITEGRTVVMTTRFAEDVHPAGELLLLGDGAVQHRGRARAFDPDEFRVWLPAPEVQDAEEEKAERVEAEALARTGEIDRPPVEEREEPR